MSDIAAAARQVAAGIRAMRKPPRDTIPWLLADPTFDEGIRLWMGADGALRGYRPDGTKMQYATTAVTAAGGSFPSDPQPELITSTYAAAWARSFCPAHGVETPDQLGYGETPEHGLRKIMIGFPSSIQTDLAAATIDRVELYLVNYDSFADPVTLHLGIHTQTSAPSTYSTTRTDAALIEVPRAGAGWYDLPQAFGRWFRDNLAEGLTIEQPPGLVNSGEIGEVDNQLRITYYV